MLTTINPVLYSLIQFFGLTVCNTLLFTKIYELLFGFQFVGITGGISTGKSTSTQILTKYHFDHNNVIDFDIISRTVVEINQPAYKSIIHIFGNDVLNDDKTINRTKLGQIVFNDKHKLSQLNKLMNKPIMYEFIKQSFYLFIVKRTGEILLDVPLLFEVGLHNICSSSILIYTDKNIQIQRLMKRDNCDQQTAVSRINAQWALDKKATLATDIIYNNGTQDELEHKLKTYIKQHINNNCCTLNKYRLQPITIIKRLFHKPNVIAFVLALITVVPVSTIVYIMSLFINRNK